MLIRKQFKYEMAHIVRKAWSRRCSKNIHGHSYEIELIIKGNLLDQGQMLIDFGLIKKWVNDFMDSFDHTFMLWNIEEDESIIKTAVEDFERVIVTPFSSSAEMQAKFIADVCERLFEEYKKTLPTEAKNYMDDSVKVHSVRVHETRTGWAEYFVDTDKASLPSTDFQIKVFKQTDSLKVRKEKDVIWMSQQIHDEWKHPDWIVAHNNQI